MSNFAAALIPFGPRNAAPGPNPPAGHGRPDGSSPPPPKASLIRARSRAGQCDQNDMAPRVIGGAACASPAAATTGQPLKLGLGGLAHPALGHVSICQQCGSAW